MPQFDVYQNKRSNLFTLLLDIQSDMLARLETRIVVPMATVRKLGSTPITRLNPTVEIDGSEYVLVFQELASVPAGILVKRVTNLAERRADIVAAVDLLITGI